MTSVEPTAGRAEPLATIRTDRYTTYPTEAEGGDPATDAASAPVR